MNGTADNIYTLYNICLDGKLKWNRNGCKLRSIVHTQCKEGIKSTWSAWRTDFDFTVTLHYTDLSTCVQKLYTVHNNSLLQRIFRAEKTFQTKVHRYWTWSKFQQISVCFQRIASKELLLMCSHCLHVLHTHTTSLVLYLLILPLTTT